MAENITVLGSGSWGTALACVTARAGHRTTLLSRSIQTVDEINTHHTNTRYLENLPIDKEVIATCAPDDALNSADVIILSVPTQTLAEKLEEHKNQLEGKILVTTCKGIDKNTGKLPHELVKEQIPQNPCAALSGPSFASDVVSGLPTAVTIASLDEVIAVKLAGMISNDTFRCYASSDIKGVELGGALKNVLALAVGAARGMKLGASAEAALIARGFSEISRLAVELGASPETLKGLSGIGDLVLTCSSPQSRNFTYGMAMGKAEPLEGLKLAEGAFTAGVALQLARKIGIEVPITEAIVAVLEKQITAREAVHNLLTRPLKREN